MMPIILHTKTIDRAHEYIDEYIREHSLSSHFVFHIRPEKTEVGIGQIRAIKKEIITANTARLFVLHSFETATIEAQNALLKTLEDQSVNNRFMLITANIERVLPTIKSRSQLLKLDDPHQISPVRSETESLFNSIVTDRSFSFLAHPFVAGIDNDEARLLIDEMILLMRRDMVTHPRILSAMKTAITSKDLLESNNLNPQLTVDSLLLQIKKSYHSS